MDLPKITYSFNVNLDDSTPINVLEWFKFQTSSGFLENELIKLVQASLDLKSQSCLTETNEYVYNQEKYSETSEDFFSGLYNWKDSYMNTFK